MQICFENITSVVVKKYFKNPAFYIIIANFSRRRVKFQIQSASLWFIQERYQESAEKWVEERQFKKAFLHFNCLIFMIFQNLRCTLLWKINQILWEKFGKKMKESLFWLTFNHGTHFSMVLQIPQTQVSGTRSVTTYIHNSI